jgi:hypothetical protein
VPEGLVGGTTRDRADSVGAENVEDIAVAGAITDEAVVVAPLKSNGSVISITIDIR